MIIAIVVTSIVTYIITAIIVGQYGKARSIDAGYRRWQNHVETYDRGKSDLEKAKIALNYAHEYDRGDSFTYGVVVGILWPLFLIVFAAIGSVRFIAEHTNFNFIESRAERYVKQLQAQEDIEIKLKKAEDLLRREGVQFE